MYKIGIVGKGFVGAAVAQGFSAGTGYKSEIRVFDKDPSKSSHSLDEVVSESDFIFISVPTPSNQDGSIHLTILEECINDINHSSIKNEVHGSIILIRSTVVPGTTRAIQEKFPELNFVFNPEFLTERSALFDFINQARFILGGKKEHTKLVKDLYEDRFGQTATVIETDFETAELTKYVCNTFFATKISFLNEMKLISDKLGTNWEDIMEGFLRDGRIGHSHTNVPGHDGKNGFGGSCFPKDIKALIHYGDTIGIDMAVLKGVWETNLKVRPEKDWEDLLGRSVISDD